MVTSLVGFPCLGSTITALTRLANACTYISKSVEVTAILEPNHEDLYDGQLPKRLF